MAHIQKIRIDNPSAKNCGNIYSTYLVTKALQILNYSHSIFYE